MLEFVQRDIFKSEADYLVNTINCVGVMGAGIALQVKKQFPAEFSEYKKACDKKLLVPGKVYVFNDVISPVIIHMTTKNHWINPSKMEYIQNGLISLKEYFETEKDNVVVALPAIGCGYGGLNWSQVKENIISELDDMNENVKVVVHEPLT